MAASPKAPFKVPTVAPGVDVAESLRRSLLVMKSEKIGYADTSPINIFEVGANMLILGAILKVNTAFDASGTSAAATATITVPNDTGGTDTIVDTSTSGLQSTGLLWSTGAAITPSTGGYVIVNYTAGTTTAGELEVYLLYVPLGENL